jgi:hypothetical protein
MRLTSSMLDGGYASAISATNTDGATATGTARLDTAPTVNTLTQAEIEAYLKAGRFVPIVGVGGSYSSVAGQYAPSGFPGAKPGSTETKAEDFEGIIVPKDYEFNLPPHSSSLPVRPITVEPDFIGKLYEENFHGLRRGRIWYFAGAGDVSKGGGDASRSGGSGDPKRVQINHNYGFQFLWNPETVTTNVQRNMDITPSNADTLRVVSGVFPGQESVSLNIVLDRTNDFAYAKAFRNRYDADPNYYLPGNGYPGAIYNFPEQINLLMKQGTMADLEYLFKAINGAGTGNGSWTTLLKKQTANVGYLSPTLLGFSLGPDAQNNLSYVGWISNISINHTAFTEEMIPIRTAVSFSIECFSGSGISSGA